MQDNSEIGAYLAAIIESSDDAIVSKNLDGTITSWNASAERIFGYKPEEIIGRHITTLIPSNRQDEETKIIEHLKKGERINHFETIRLAKDGHEIELSITVSPIRNSKGIIIGASKVARDITDRRLAERALVELSERKDEFLANMSHELRTPMNAVVGLATILSKSEPLTEKQKKFIDTLKLSADNLLALINDLLDFAKLESHNVELEEIDFNIKDVIANIANMMDLKAKEKGLALGVEYQHAFNSQLIGDPLRIGQIITNLVSNAIKFTSEGHVKIKLGTKPIEGTNKSQVTVQIIDSGIGVAHDKQGIIFEKFTQADASFTRKYGGTGLGLSICKALVSQMGGTIELSSAPGQGSTFTVILPLENGKQSRKENASGHLGDTGVNDNKSILLVEDYIPNIVVASEFLERLGYDFDTAMTGTEALNRLEKTTYDLILMDVQMHGIDGLETTRQIRKQEEVKKLIATPIIAMTAHVHEANKAACYAAGMNDFIPKPFDPEELSRKLKTLIAEKKRKLTL